MKKISTLFLAAALGLSSVPLLAAGAGPGGGASCPDATEVGPETCNCTSINQPLGVCHSAQFPFPGTPSGYLDTGKSSEDCDVITVAAGKCVYWEYVWSGQATPSGSSCLYTIVSRLLKEKDCPS